MILESFSRDYQQITFVMVNRFCLLNKPPPPCSPVLLFLTDKAGWNTKRYMAFLNCIPTIFCISYYFYISFYISRFYYSKLFRTSSTLSEKRYFHHKFSSFTGFTDTPLLPQSLNSQNIA